MKTLCGLRMYRILMTTALAAVFGAVMLSGGWARADLLGLIETYPDIYCAGITVDYNDDTDTLSTTYGYPCQFTYPKPEYGPWMYHDPSDPDLLSKVEEPIVYGAWPGGFVISMTLDSNNQPTGGSLEIRGYIPALQGMVEGETDPTAYHDEYYTWANDSTLLTGNIAQFSYNVSAEKTQDDIDIFINTMELVFDTTGGVLDDFYNGQIGVYLSWNSFTPESTIHFDGNFNSDTEESQQSVLADVFVIPIPEPSIAILILTSIGCAAVFSVLRKIRRN